MFAESYEDWALRIVTGPLRRAMHFRHTVRCVRAGKDRTRQSAKITWQPWGLNTVRLFRLTAFGGRIMR